MSQIYEKDEYFGCSFGFRNMELLFLGESKFIVSRIIDWQEICDDLLERGEWLMVMALLISVKDNQNKLIPVKDDDEFNESYLQKVSEISNEYIELIIKQKE